MSVSAYLLIINHEIVTEHFGYWPNFHDAEILRFELDRRHVVKPPGPSLSFDVHVFEVAPETDELGYCKFEKHCIVTFEFDNVRLLAFEGFNHQNAVYEITFDMVRDVDHVERIEVHVNSSHGVSACFSADQGVVSKLVVGLPNEGVYCIGN
jgi:hypothetical protein